MAKLYNRISQELVRTHDAWGHAAVSLVDATRLKPGEWIKSVGDRVLCVGTRHINERKDVRQFLWDMEKDADKCCLDIGADVVWSWFDEEEGVTCIGLGKRVLEPVAVGEGLMVTGGAQ